jgi:hypothetical protein
LIDTCGGFTRIVWKPGRKRALKETMQVCENNTSIALLRTGVVHEAYGLMH